MAIPLRTKHSALGIVGIAKPQRNTMRPMPKPGLARAAAAVRERSSAPGRRVAAARVRAQDLDWAAKLGAVEEAPPVEVRSFLLGQARQVCRSA